jgi:hypothetical protein
MASASASYIPLRGWPHHHRVYSVVQTQDRVVSSGKILKNGAWQAWKQSNFLQQKNGCGRISEMHGSWPPAAMQQAEMTSAILHQSRHTRKHKKVREAALARHAVRTPVMQRHCTP